MLDKEIIQEILDTGLIIIGSKKCGKSNSAKVLASEIIRGYPNIQCRIFDSCQVWVHEFDPILYHRINDNIRFLYIGNKHILYNIEYLDPELRMKAIESIVRYDRKQQEELKWKGQMNRWIVYIIEEAQNILGRYALSRESGKYWCTFISEGRNFNQAFVMIGQRAADISAQIIERAQGYLFGRASGDNDKSKIKRIVGKRARMVNQLVDDEWIKITGDKIAEETGQLQVGELIYFNGEKGSMIKFPEYKSGTKPILMRKQ